MSYLDLMGRMAKIQYQKLTEKKAKPVRTPAPLGLHQGSAVEVDVIVRSMIKSAGGVMPAFDRTQYVVSVGTFLVDGVSFTRSYLSDGKSFVQTFADKSAPNGVGECRLFTPLREERPITSPVERDWLLAEADGWIGYPVFNAGTDTAPIWYAREWAKGGETRVPHVNARETVVGIDGHSVAVWHRFMAYGRKLGAPEDMSAPNEFLIVDAIQTDDGYEALDLWVGIDLDAATLTVRAA